MVSRDVWRGWGGVTCMQCPGPCLFTGRVGSGRPGQSVMPSLETHYTSGLLGLQKNEIYNGPIFIGQHTPLF